MMDFRKSSSYGMSMTETGGFRGYPVPFLNIDHQRNISIPGIFSKAIPLYLDGGGQILLDHDNRAESIIAKAMDAGEDSRGFWVDGIFSGGDRAQEVRKRASEGFVKKMSSVFHGKSRFYKESQIHALWKNYGFEPDSRQIELAKRGADVITEVDRIDEVSIVAIPANSKAEIIAVKSFDGHIETPLTVAPRIDLAALARRASLADKVLGR